MDHTIKELSDLQHAANRKRSEELDWQEMLNSKAYKDASEITKSEFRIGFGLRRNLCK